MMASAAEASRPLRALAALGAGLTLHFLCPNTVKGEAVGARIPAIVEPSLPVPSPDVVESDGAHQRYLSRQGADPERLFLGKAALHGAVEASRLFMRAEYGILNRQNQLRLERGDAELGRDSLQYGGSFSEVLYLERNLGRMLSTGDAGGRRPWRKRPAGGGDDNSPDSVRIGDLRKEVGAFDSGERFHRIFGGLRASAGSASGPAGEDQGRQQTHDFQPCGEDEGGLCARAVLGGVSGLAAVGPILCGVVSLERGWRRLGYLLWAIGLGVFGIAAWIDMHWP